MAVYPDDPKKALRPGQKPPTALALAVAAALLALAVGTLWFTAQTPSETVADPQFLSAPGATLPRD